MAHIVKVVEDHTLATEAGWAMARAEDTGDLYFVVERTAATSERVLTDAWDAARHLEESQAIELAVARGIQAGRVRVKAARLDE